MDEQELYTTSQRVIGSNEVIRADGKAVRFDEIIKRRWGWPRSAAKMAGKYIYDCNQSVAIETELRTAQQAWLFVSVDGLLEVLLNGLARGSTKEAKDNDRILDRVNINFSEDIYDEGVITALTSAIGMRFGASTFKARNSIKYSTGPLGERLLFVDVREIES